MDSPKIPKDIMFPSFHRRHLFKQVFACQEAYTCKKGQNANTDTIVACICILVVEAYFFFIDSFFNVAFAAYAPEDNDCEELKTILKYYI